MVGGQLCGLWGWVLVGVAVHRCRGLDFFTIVFLHCGIRGGGGVLELFPCMHSMAGINPSVANETGSSVGALLYTLSCPESVGVGLVTVKPATPFNALCRYIYIHICSHAFYITTGFTTSIFNKPLDSSLFVSFIEESSSCSSVAAGPSRWASTPPWWSSLTSPPSCPRWWARTF